VADTNREVARLLEELATLTELDEGSPNAFRVRAYQNAERAVLTLQEDVAELSANQLAQVKGIGKSIAGRIREFVDTGSIDRLEELRTKHPASKVELMKIPGLGPKTVQLLADELGITDLDGLAAGLEDGSVAELSGLGEKTVENIREGIEQLGLSSKDQRVPIADALPTAERIVAALRELDGVADAAYAGSLRRFAETIGDVDVLVAADDADPVTSAFLEHSEVDRLIGSGGTKTSVVTRDGLQVDLRVVPPESFGAALVYFTGSKAHNIRLRQRALERGWTLNEYALATQDDDEVVAAATEEEVYAALELPWIAPERREDDGEIEAALDGSAPTLVEVDDLRGDLHDHTDLSGDGRDTLEDLVAAAVDRGLDYLAITDHAEDLSINGVSREAMLEQRRAVRELEAQRGDIALLHGAELNIGVDGTLDYDADLPRRLRLAGRQRALALRPRRRGADRPGRRRDPASERHRDRPPHGSHARQAGRDRTRPRGGLRRGRRDGHGHRDQRQPAPPRRAGRGDPRRGTPWRDVRDLDRRPRRDGARPRTVRGRAGQARRPGPGIDRQHLGTRSVPRVVRTGAWRGVRGGSQVRGVGRR